ncbi:MAG: DUF167 domain-containing protein [Candidatus Pacebacteria bacterium]|nr:DUF167 domain-containing protein [Candidatus Paceibacterota bacterium]
MRIYVKVTPRSSRNEVVKISDGEYKVRLTAAPVDGAANEALVKLLAEYFDVAKSNIKIVGGKSARTKVVDIDAK